MKNYIYIFTILVLITSCKGKMRTNILTKSALKIEKTDLITEAIKEKVILTDSLSKVLIASVLKQLKISDDKCKHEFASANKSPYNNNESIIIIPEIVVEEDEGLYYELNSHILLVNNKTGKINSAFFESNKTNGWTSDALYITDIEIDSTLYQVKDNTKAFGIKIRFMGSSKPNPYSSEYISLFIQKEESLQKIANYETSSYTGEWDMNCTGEFFEKTSILRPTTNTTNGFYDINVSSAYTTTTSFINKDRECDDKKDVSFKTTKLVFSDNEYRKNTQ